MFDLCHRLCFTNHRSIGIIFHYDDKSPNVERLSPNHSEVHINKIQCFLRNIIDVPVNISRQRKKKRLNKKNK